MDFDRLLDGAEVAGNLFVQFASDDIIEHFAFTRCERGQALANFGKLALLPAKREVFLKRRMNGYKQLFIIDGLGEKISGAVLHRLDTLGNVTFARQKNNWKEASFIGEDALEFKAIDGRHGKIEHETTPYAGIILCQEFLRRRKRCHSK